jgi:hypothetical protein
MQIFIDLDLRQAVTAPGDRSPMPTQQCSSQDTLENDVYFVRGGVLFNAGSGVALKMGLFAGAGAVSLVSVFSQQTDGAGANFWQGMMNLNTVEMAAAIGAVPAGQSLLCNAQLRYQLADGEIIHTIYLPFAVFPTLLLETGTPPPNVSSTYPDVSQLVLISQKGAASGIAELSSSKLLNPAEIPIDGTTVVLNTSQQLSVPIDGATIAMAAGKLAVPLDESTIELLNGKVQSSLILTTFKAAWNTVADGTTVAAQVNDSSQVKLNQVFYTPIAGWYSVTAITDANNITIKNTGDPANAIAGVTIALGAVLLPGQVASSTGATITLTAGTVTGLAAGATPTASITGAAPNFVINLGIPAGQPGLPGTPGSTPTLSIGTVVTLVAGTSATASITGTAPNYLLNLGIPQGAAGTGGTGAGLNEAGASGPTGANPPGSPVAPFHSFIWNAAGLSLKTVKAGSANLTITEDNADGALVFDAVGIASLTDAETTTGSTLIGASTGQIKRLVAGTNVTLDTTTTPGAVTIAAAVGGAGVAAVTDAETSTGVSLINASTGVFKRLVAGANTTIDSSDPTKLTLAATAGTGGVAALTDAETSAGVSLISASTGVLNRIIAGAHLSIDTTTTPGGITLTGVAGGGFDPSTGIDETEDFLSYNGGAFKLGWVPHISGSGLVSCPAIPDSVTTGYDAVGLVQLDVTAASDVAAITLGDLAKGNIYGYRSVNGSTIHTFRILISSKGTGVTFLFGLANSASGVPSTNPGDYFLFSNVGGGATPFNGINNRAGGQQQSAALGSGTADVGGTFHKFQISVDATAHLQFFIDGSQVGTVSGSFFPLTSLCPVIWLFTSSAPASVQCDYVRIQKTFAR